MMEHLPWLGSTFMLLVTFGIFYAVRLRRLGAVVTLFPLAISTIDEFIDGNLTVFRQLSLILYGLCIILALYYNVRKGKLQGR